MTTYIHFPKSALFLTIIILLLLALPYASPKPASAVGEDLTISAPVTLSGTYGITATRFSDKANPAFYFEPSGTSILSSVTGNLTGTATNATNVTGGTISATTGIFSGTLTLSNNTITCTGCVETTDILTDTILAGDIAAGAVGTSEIADGTVGAADIGADAITASELAANSVGDSELFNGGTWTLTSGLTFTGDASVDLSMSRASTNVSGNWLNSYKARGSQAAKTIVSTADDILLLRAYGYDGASNLEAARITMETDGTVASTRMPGNIIFYTATDAAPSVLTERVRIDSAGNVGVGTAAPTYKFQVAGTVYASGSSKRYKQNIK